VRYIVDDAVSGLRSLPDGYAQCCVTSPPYYRLRDYGVAGQIGLEESPDAYVARLVEVFREVWRVLRDDGTLWLNLGDSYAGNGDASGFRPGNDGASNRNGVGRVVGCKTKDLLGIPWMVAFALRADGWYLRADIIWHKPNPMPESISDRPTRAHEHVFLFSKSPSYFYDADAIKEPPAESSVAAYKAAIANPRKDREYQHDSQTRKGKRRANRAWSDPDNLRRLMLGKNARDVWTIATQPYSGAHFATMPPALVERCIKAGSRPSDRVLDPFGGAGTTAVVAHALGRTATLIDLNRKNLHLTAKRIGAGRIDVLLSVLADEIDNLTKRIKGV
jgi:DNA modification methylase